MLYNCQSRTFRLYVVTDTAPNPSRRGPGRPRRYESDTLLDACLDLFWKRGVRNTTTRDLESHLGLSQSSIYHEFHSKQELLTAALDRYESRTNEALLKPLQSGSDLEAVIQFFRNLSHWVTHDGRKGCMLINMMAEDGDADPEIVKRTRRYRMRVTRALSDCLDRAMVAGSVSPGDNQVRANILIGLVLGFNVAARGGAGPRELERMLEATLVEVNGWRR